MTQQHFVKNRGKIFTLMNLKHGKLLILVCVVNTFKYEAVTYRLRAIVRYYRSNSTPFVEPNLCKQSKTYLFDPFIDIIDISVHSGKTKITFYGKFFFY